MLCTFHGKVVQRCAQHPRRLHGFCQQCTSRSHGRTGNVANVQRHARRQSKTIDHGIPCPYHPTRKEWSRLRGRRSPTVIMRLASTGTSALGRARQRMPSAATAYMGPGSMRLASTITSTLGRARQRMPSAATAYMGQGSSSIQQLGVASPYTTGAVTTTGAWPWIISAASARSATMQVYTSLPRFPNTPNRTVASGGKYGEVGQRS